MPIAAFFDLDRTLIDCNSGMLYARSEHRQGRITLWMLLQGLTWGMLYHFSMIDLDKAMGQALEYYRGTPEELMRDRTAEFFAEEIRQRLQPGAREAIEYHRSLGHECVMLTNSSPYMADVATEGFGLDSWLANRFLLDDDKRLTGEFELPLCYGAGKAVRSEAWAKERGIDLASCFFYTDSYSDLPMLEVVGEPRVVNPDPKLRRTAKRKGWQILDWSQVDTGPKLLQAPNQA